MQNEFERRLATLCVRHLGLMVLPGQFNASLTHQRWHCTSSSVKRGVDRRLILAVGGVKLECSDIKQLTTAAAAAAAATASIVCAKPRQLSTARRR